MQRPFLDIAGRVLAGGERGLLGLAFHPRFSANGRFFVNYTRKADGATVISEFRVSANPNVAPAGTSGGSSRYCSHLPTIMAACSPSARMAASSSASATAARRATRGNRAQNRQVLLGKILRVDVNSGQPYAIPPANPFAAGGGRPEIYALGFRNPWRFSFDRGTGRLYAGDVGQRRGRGGRHRPAWRQLRLADHGGQSVLRPATGCNRQGLTPPIATYSHTGGRCSITGGYVYRGSAVPALVGTYVYADFCSGEIFGRRGGQSTVLLDTSRTIASFGENQAGELFVVGLGGTIDRIAAR